MLWRVKSTAKRASSQRRSRRRLPLAGCGRSVVAGSVGNDGGLEQLVPKRGRDQERCDHNRASTVGACLCHERVDKRRRGKGEERPAMKSAAGRASGAGPAGYGEGVFSLSAGFSEASEEAWKEGVRLGGESVDGQGPAAQGGELAGLSSDEVAADRAGDLGSAGVGVVVNTLGDEDPAGSVEVQGVAAHAALEPARAHRHVCIRESGRA